MAELPQPLTSSQQGFKREDGDYFLSHQLKCILILQMGIELSVAFLKTETITVVTHEHVSIRYLSSQYLASHPYYLLKNN